MLAFETGGVAGLLCITRTIPTPQTTPTIHETIMAFVILHIGRLPQTNAPELSRVINCFLNCCPQHT
jgi:hypothetical protein